MTELNDRLRAVAAAYATNPGGTIVVSPDNQSRGQLNTRIRTALQETGHVSREDRAITVLVPRQDLTGADRRWASHYETGDVVRYTRGSPEHALEPGAYARVSAVDGRRTSSPSPVATGRRSSTIPVACKASRSIAKSSAHSASAIACSSPPHSAPPRLRTARWARSRR
jgi:hypothetical protein